MPAFTIPFDAVSGDQLRGLQRHTGVMVGWLGWRVIGPVNNAVYRTHRVIPFTRSLL
jgi:hypothetical protein